MFTARLKQSQPNDRTSLEKLLKGCEATLGEAMEGRLKVPPKVFHEVLRQRKVNYGKKDHSPAVNPELLKTNSVILTMVDKMGRRYYNRLLSTGLTKPYLEPYSIGTEADKPRLMRLSQVLLRNQIRQEEPTKDFSFRSFYKRTLNDRMMIVTKILILDGAKVPN